jgi:hypothetical protein
MKRTLPFIMLVLLGSQLSAVDNPNVRSPVGSPTAVPSATRSGLIPNRSYDAGGSGNDVMTGNVGGMRHFRGAVPYGSSYYTGSSAFSPVDDFLRRASDPIADDRSPGQYRSYYDPRRTVGSAVRPDGSGLFSPVITNRGQTDPYTPPKLAQTLDTQYSSQRPPSLSASELERVLSRQMMLREDAERLRQTQDGQETPAKERVAESFFFQEYLKPKDLEPVKELSAQDTADLKPTLKPEQEVHEAFREQYAEKLLEGTPERTAALLRPLGESSESGAGRSSEGRSGTQTDKQATQPRVPQTVEQAEAAALLSRYKTFERLAAVRLAEYLAAAETFLKEGKFYKAADTFALATIWGPTDARPYAGQAFSLFAAGEYMSSAFYLSQAMLRNPEVASQKVDLAGLIGDRDVYENRVIEMTTWQERSGSGELAFMMAFVFHQDGKTERAADAILIAAEKMPGNTSVVILRDAILSTAGTK